jgi:hypothetical protein
MATQYEYLNSDLEKFIKAQKIFFVATAMETGTVNLSPKGMDTFRILDSKRAMWLNLTGSGNETATHLQHSERITIMFCSFERKPLILRLYGKAKVYHPRDNEWKEYIKMFPEEAGSRQLVDIEIEMVQTSCGYAIPFMDYTGERDVLRKSSEKKGDEGIKKYWEEKNTTSLDGHSTGIFD